MKIAALQFAPERTDVSKNLKRLKELVLSTECELIVLPELASTGYFYTDKEELLPLAEQAGNGEFSSLLLELAAVKQTVIIGGFAERTADNALYNSALIALPDGTWHVYRKTHLFYKEKLIFTPGDTGFQVVDWNGVRIGTMICYDWRFPEAARSLALQGADIIAHPSNLVAEYRLWGPTILTRAFENRVFIITANRWGSEILGGEELVFSGMSQISGTSLTAISTAPATGDLILTADIDPISTRKKSFNTYNDILLDRRPELYTNEGRP